MIHASQLPPGILPIIVEISDPPEKPRDIDELIQELEDAKAEFFAPVVRPRTITWIALSLLAVTLAIAAYQLLKG
jgi:hypothetical protein